MIKQLGKKVFNSNGTLSTINLQYFFNEKSSIDCLIVLNCKSDYQLLRNMIDCCESIIVADGGANHLYQSPNRDEQKVKWIVGDLDSIRPQVQDYYRNKNVQICKVWDQDHNDLQKSLMKGQQQNFHHFICFGALGGRMDHTLSSLHIGTKIGRNYSDMEIILIGDGNLMIYLRPNITYNIILSQKIQRSGCGLITFNKVNKIVTKGFKWNLGPQNGIQSLEWGNFISTSNQFASNQVSIHSSEEIYFVCRIKIKQ